MKVKDVNKIKGVEFTGGNSQRFVLEDDNLGFAMMKTNVKQGGAYLWHYKNHLECCYCISGKGIIKNLETGESFEIKKDIAYLLDKHDKHEFTAITDCILISVFNPPLKGNEKHDKNGNYGI